MGQLLLTPTEWEAVMTFVLGLVGEAAKYVTAPPGFAQRAVGRGRKVLDKYGCAECHTLRAEMDGGGRPGYVPLRRQPRRMTPSCLIYRPGQSAGIAVGGAPRFVPSRVVGMPSGRPMASSRSRMTRAIRSTLRSLGAGVEDGNAWPVARGAVKCRATRFWRSGRRSGETCPAPLPDRRSGRRTPDGSTAAEPRHRGSRPPWCAGSTGPARWLHQYLMEPCEIRPASVLRMPKYRFPRRMRRDWSSISRPWSNGVPLRLPPPRPHRRPGDAQTEPPFPRTGHTE